MQIKGESSMSVAVIMNNTKNTEDIFFLYLNTIIWSSKEITHVFHEQVGFQHTER